MRDNGSGSSGGVAISTSATTFPGIHFFPSGKFTGRIRVMTCSFTWRIAGGWHSRVVGSDWRQIQTVGEGGQLHVDSPHLLMRRSNLRTTY